MRLKEDNRSWKSGGIKHRDNRHDKSTEEIGKHVGKKKNTKKWCGGKEGKKHKLGYEKTKFFYLKDKYVDLICVNCKKQFSYFIKQGSCAQQEREMEKIRKKLGYE